MFCPSLDGKGNREFNLILKLRQFIKQKKNITASFMTESWTYLAIESLHVSKLYYLFLKYLYFLYISLLSCFGRTELSVANLFFQTS